MTWIKRIARKAGAPSTDGASAPVQTYVTKTPHPQNALDLFAGEWASKLPPPFENLTSGTALLFQDVRMEWAIERIGGAAGKRVLELGPLEGGHTYLLDRAGAADVLAIEANTRAYLRCLVAKELLGIRAGRFVCGDFLAYLRDSPERVDAVVASGVLYHMVTPVELIAKAASVTDALYLWTHYYDEAIFTASPRFARRIVAPETAEHEGYRHDLYRHDYRAAVEQPGFCGGSRPYSNWLTREGILGALRHFGLHNIEINFEQTGHENGPAFSVVARR